MKTVFLPLFFLLAQFVRGQSEAVMLFSDFQNGTVYLRNQKINVPLNYDAGKHCMLYLQNGQNMILTNIQSVDSIHIGKHRFTRIKNRFYELVSYHRGVLLIDWTLEKVHVGYRGAYGQVSQIKTHSVNLSLITGHDYDASANMVTSTDVYKQKNRNIYCILQNEKVRKFKDKRTLLKLFPEYNEEILALIKKQGTDFTKVDDIIVLMEEVFKLGLK